MSDLVGAPVAELLNRRHCIDEARALLKTRSASFKEK